MGQFHWRGRISKMGGERLTQILAEERRSGGAEERPD